MFQSQELNAYLKSSHTIEQEHVITAEWNLNEPDNIKLVGNYRYRPTDTESVYNSIAPIFDPIDARKDYTGATQAHIALQEVFDDEDNPILFTPQNKKMELLYSLEDCLKPFRPRSGINKILYLSTFGAPIGYNQYIDSLTRYVARRPRYYMSSRDDQFKYWTSYRTEVIDGATVEFGVSGNETAGDYFINDAAPFVAYKEPVPANRIVLKMQTNVGEEDLGPYRTSFEQTMVDPLYGDNNRTVPKLWKVQVLKNNSWLDVIKFSPTSFRNDGSQIIKADGYVELAFGLDIPPNYTDIFLFAGYLTTTSSLPETAPLGYTYIVRAGDTERGTAYIYTGSDAIPELPGWSSFDPSYSWTLVEEEMTRNSKIVKKLINPENFIINNEVTYREFDLIDGIRIVVDKMNVANATFDLIEMSPRLVADISEITKGFNITRTLSDLGNSSIPVGSLLASTGSISIFDEDFIFNENNAFDKDTRRGSVVANRTATKIKFNFYEIVKNVNRYDYFIPLKTMYSEGIPKASDASVNIDIDLRDLYFLFESEKAPEMLLTDVSLSYAITVLLDNIGFSNYVFKRLNTEKEYIIPYFFVGADQNVAQVLQDLAISTQTAMFFDEYNNFVVMSKDYILPPENGRGIDVAFYGHEEEWAVDPGYAKIVANYVTIQTNVKHYLSVGDKVIVTGFDIDINGEKTIETVTDYTISYSVSNKENTVDTSGGRVRSRNLPNIINLASDQKMVYNNGQINYTTRYIQKSIGTYAQAYYNAEGQNYVYKPVLLWEVAAPETVSSVNELPSQAQGYYLTAVPLKTSLTNSIPEVVNGQLVNNIIDVGENIYWMTSKYSGYLNANGEIIKYDALEYSVQGVGNVWISSSHEYLDYFQNLQFNGKMYPTGRIRIYTEPEYQSLDGVLKLKSGPVKKHGRGQFGTNIVYHSAGLTDDLYWTNNDYVRGCIQDAKKYLFSMNNDIEYPASLGQGIAGKNKSTTLVSINADEYSKNSTRNSVIKNFLSNKNITEKDATYYKTAKTGSIQTSALIFNGPSIPDQIDDANFVSYIYKDLTTAVPDQTITTGEIGTETTNVNIPYTHFGTRMRILGKVESGTNKTQTPIGAYELFTANQASTTNPSDIVTFSGGSGGIGFNLNKDTNNGYFYEIVALTSDQIKNYSVVGNVVSYDIVKTYTDNSGEINVQVVKPGISVTEDIATIVTQTQHSFKIGDKVIVSGATDKDRPKNTSTTINGELTVTEIGTDRKSFFAQISQPNNLGEVGIVSAIGDGTAITYRTVDKVFRAGQLVNIKNMNNVDFNFSEAIIDSVISNAKVYTLISGVRVNEGGEIYARYTTSSPHDFVVGQKIDISSMAPDPFNIKSAEVVDVSTYTFKVRATGLVDELSTKGGTAYGISETFTVKGTPVGNGSGGTVQYIPLTTTCESGAVVKISSNTQSSISNVFFYKVLAGSNISQIIKVKKDAKTGFIANQATVTFAQPHAFSIGDEIQIEIFDEAIKDQFNGTYIVNEATEYTVSYTTSNFGVVPETDLSELGTVVATEKTAIPQIMWSGLAEINVDDGLFATETRFTNSESTTIYDISAEYVKMNDNSLRFYLYLNGKQIATVDDTEPLPTYNNMSVFVRGSSRCMFENVYAIGKNETQSLIYPTIAPIVQSGFGELYQQKTADVVRRYGVSDIIKNTYYSGLSAKEPPKYNMWFEEFGTIMREVAYFNIKYDRAYPALYAKIAPVINDIKAYNISGFYAGAYRAEFLIFNNMDKTINLDDTTGNYLRIFGISFTQNTTRTLRIDEYLDKVGNLADPTIQDGIILYNPFLYREMYDQLKKSRLKYGNVEFSIDGPFIQTTAAAEELLDWIIKKTYLPKKAVGIQVFGTSTIQLGDICTINYKNTEGVYVLGDPTTRYIVYNIEYSKSESDKSMTVYLVEV